MTIWLQDASRLNSLGDYLLGYGGYFDSQTSVCEANKGAPLLPLLVICAQGKEFHSWCYSWWDESKVPCVDPYGHIWVCVNTWHLKKPDDWSSFHHSNASVWSNPHLGLRGWKRDDPTFTGTCSLVRIHGGCTNQISPSLPQVALIFHDWNT